jgi:hypothetical protein
LNERLTRWSAFLRFHILASRFTSTCVEQGQGNSSNGVFAAAKACREAVRRHARWKAGTVFHGSST